MSPCPHCNRPPSVELCAPWEKKYGPQPWHVGCYCGGGNEHYIGAVGDNEKAALALWEDAVAARPEHEDVK